MSKKVAMIGGGPQQGGGTLLGGHPCLFVVNLVVMISSNKVASKLLEVIKCFKLDVILKRRKKI